MNAARLGQIAAEPSPNAAGRTSDQSRRDFGEEFESALSGADGGKEKPETAVSETAAGETLASIAGGMAGLRGEAVAAQAAATFGASPDPAKGWNAAASMRLASLLAAQVADTPPSDPAVSTGLAGQASLEDDTTALPRTRVGVVAMATHFEPNAREPQLVPGTAEDAAARGAPIAAALREATGVALAGAFGEKAGSAKTIAADGDGQGGEKAAAKTDAPREAALAMAGAAGGKSAGEGGESGRRGERNASPREHATGNPSEVPAPGTLLQTQLADPLATASSIGGQVAERVSLALAPLAQHPSASGQAEAMLRFKAGGGALRSIQIQLQPENLGTVDVSMRLVNGELAIELVASEADTARTLSQDTEALRAVLEKAGFSLDEAAISIVARDHATARPGQASPATPSDGQGGSSEARHDGPPADDSGQRRQQAKGAPVGHLVADASEPRRSERGSSVYL